MLEGTIVDATLIAAPPSTKNRDKERDPEMHQSKKSNDWHFGMKAHVGVGMATGLAHSVVGTAGNVADVTQAHALLHGGEKAVLSDAGYQDVGKRAENADKAIDWTAAMPLAYARHSRRTHRDGRRKSWKRPGPAFGRKSSTVSMS